MSNENEKITKEELLKKLDEVGLEDHALDMVAGGGSLDKVKSCIDHQLNILGVTITEAQKRCFPSRSS